MQAVGRSFLVLESIRLYFDCISIRGLEEEVLLESTRKTTRLGKRFDRVLDGHTHKELGLKVQEAIVGSNERRRLID